MGEVRPPDTGADGPPNSAPLHVDGAAWAAALAIDKGVSGIFNIAETNSAREEMPVRVPINTGSTTLAVTASSAMKRTTASTVGPHPGDATKASAAGMIKARSEPRYGTKLSRAAETPQRSA